MTIGFVRNHGATGASASASTIPLTFAAAVPAGNFIVLGAHCATTGLTATAADTKGNTYQVDVTFNSGTFSVFIVSARITVALTTSDVVTVTFSTGVTNRLISVDEFTGLDGTTWFDTGHSNNGTSVTPDSGNATPARSGSLLYGTARYANAGAAYAPGTTNSGAYTYIESGEFKIASNPGIETEYYIGAAAVAVSANGTITSAAWQQCLAIYKPASGAGIFMVL